MDSIKAEFIRTVLDLELVKQHTHDLCCRHTAVDADIGHRAELRGKHCRLFDRNNCEQKCEQKGLLTRLQFTKHDACLVVIKVSVEGASVSLDSPDSKPSSTNSPSADITVGPGDTIGVC